MPEMIQKYSIKDLERISGIKAHTIRIWEQRYHIISPERTHSNIRSYNSDDLRRLLNISLLNRSGFKISQIAGMPADEIQRLVLSVIESDHGFQNQVNALTLSMVSLDEDRFEKIVSSNILRYGFEKTMIKILDPFLEKIGLMWLAGAINPAQEHFISNLIRQKLIVAIDGQMNPNNKEAQKFLLFCPEGELHEIGLLFMNYLIRSRNQSVVYLGVSVPFDDLNDICQIKNPDYLMVMITTTPSGPALTQYIQRLNQAFPDKTILLAGYQFKEFNNPFKKGVVHLKDIEAATIFLDQLKDNKLKPRMEDLGMN
jgi:DNA-binding transcriptional MerR regulator